MPTLDLERPQAPLGQLRYRCGACGEIHRGLPDVSFAAPLAYYALPQHERLARAVLSRDACVLDDRDYFLRARLSVPVEGTAQRFGWLVWCLVGESEFWPHWQARHDAVEGTRRVAGALANRLPGFPDTIGLSGQLEAEGGGRLPVLRLEACPHPLAMAQDHGLAGTEALGFAQEAGARLVIG